MATDPHRNLSNLFCRITMLLEDLHIVASKGMSRQLNMAQYARRAGRIQKGAVKILVLAAMAEKQAKKRP